MAGPATHTQVQTSTVDNFTSAWNWFIETALARGYISERVPVLKLTAGGEKGKTRPAFPEQEVKQLLTFMDVWQQGRMAVKQEIRPLLRDYIGLLLITGMRHGTEAMNIFWQHIGWHTHETLVAYAHGLMVRQADVGS